jgi:hypothetical protein
MATPTNLPASFTAGQVLTAAQQNSLRGAFRILQVISATSSTPTSNSTGTFLSNGLSVTITPQSTSSKIFVLCSTNARNTAGTNTAIWTIYRDSTNLGEPTYGMGELAETGTVAISLSYLDNPASTSAITYTMRQRVGLPTTATSQQSGATGSITVFEVSL